MLKIFNKNLPNSPVDGLHKTIIKTSALQSQLPESVKKLNDSMKMKTLYSTDNTGKLMRDKFLSPSKQAAIVAESMMKKAFQMPNPIKEIHDSMMKAWMSHIPDPTKGLNDRILVIPTFSPVEKSISDISKRAFSSLHNKELFNLVSMLNLPLSELAAAIGINPYDYNYKDSEEDCDDEPADKEVIPRTNGEVIILDANIVLIRKIQREPNTIYKIAPYLFEEIMATIFEQQGYEVKLTKKTRDGGKDIYLIDNRAIGKFTYIIECKRNSVSNKVGVGIIRQLFGVVNKEHVNAGIVVTTSSFTQPAKEFQQDVGNQIILNDYSNIQKWINQYK